MLIFLTAGLPLLIAASLLAWSAIRGLRLYQKIRIVVCPENREAVAVRADAQPAPTAALPDNVDYRLRSCSRWPEKRNCDQACRSQIAGAARGCAARATIARTKRVTSCALCGVALGRGPGIQKPVLMSPDRKTMTEWDAIPPGQLLFALSTHSQICWTCYMSASYRSVRSLPSLDSKPARLTAAS